MQSMELEEMKLERLKDEEILPLITVRTDRIKVSNCSLALPGF